MIRPHTMEKRHPNKKRNSSIVEKPSSSKRLGSNSQILKEMWKPSYTPTHLEGKKMFLNTSTKPLLLRLTVTKQDIAQHLDVKTISPSNVANRKESKDVELYSIILPDPNRNVKQHGNTSQSKPTTKRSKLRHQVQSPKLEFLNFTAKKAKLVPGHYPPR
ncbi:hypothetical protein A2U01_0014437 [Trifolium medium]|uniref:Uncharacterized protein n=1 Tax=Trifolium medium TaxID=97028 RepID=A0A392N2W8_9FABA|nr:hypothetical protein [Trifolium medium]